MLYSYVPRAHPACAAADHQAPPWASQNALKMCCFRRLLPDAFLDAFLNHFGAKKPPKMRPQINKNTSWNRSGHHVCKNLDLC